MSRRRIKMRKIINKRGVVLLLFVIFICLFVIAQFDTNVDNVDKYKCDKNHVDVVFIWTNDIDTNIFKDGIQLKYFLRSIELGLPWVNNIFIITYEKIPTWLNIKNEKIKLIPFSKILHKKDDLRNYSTTAVLSKLHRLKDLSQCFIYFKDNIFPLKLIKFEDFYTSDEGYKIYLGEIFGKCSPKCFSSQINNNVCDLHCYNKKCNYDGNDCKRANMRKYVNKHYEDKEIINYSSIEYTIDILNLIYGKNFRRMYQHTPILFQKNILKNMHRKLEEFNKDNKLLVDVDFVFFYYQFVVNEKLNENISIIFDYFDTNKDSYWTNEEMFEVFIVLFRKELQNMKKFDTYYVQCREFLKISTEANKNFQILNQYYISVFSQIDKETVVCCQSLIDLLTYYFHQLSKYEHKIIDKNDVLDIEIDFDINNAFEKINNDTRKFLHIRINETNVKDENVKSIILSFYDILFQKRSRYEHNRGNVNPYKSIAEFQIWENINKIDYTLITICSIVIIIILFSCTRMYLAYRNNKIKRFKL